MWTVALFCLLTISQPAVCELQTGYAESQSFTRVLLVGGIVHKKGQITSWSLTVIPAGVNKDEDESGNSSSDLVVRMLDSSGQTLAQATTGLEFMLETDPPIATDATSFGVDLPYPKTADRIEISWNGQTLVSQFLHSKLLSDVIDAMPDTSFREDLTQTREDLRKTVDEMDQLLEARNRKAALQLLVDVLRPRLQHVLAQKSDKKYALDLSKHDALERIDWIIQALRESAK